MDIKGTIDRFEGRFAIVETGGKMEKIERRILPAGTREGTCIIIRGDRAEIDEAATKAAREKAGSFLKNLK